LAVPYLPGPEKTKALAMPGHDLLFAKTPARREINNIAAAISPPFCYKS
jgi:hypothetical protein